MAHSLSAKKRIRQNAKKRAINRTRKSGVKTEVKHFETALKSGDVEMARERFRLAVRRLDKTASKSTMHKNTAARKKSQLAKRLNALIAKKASG